MSDDLALAVSFLPLAVALTNGFNGNMDESGGSRKSPPPGPETGARRTEKPMANEQLESFLATATTPEPAQAAPDPAPEPTGDPTPEPAAKPDAAKQEDADEDGAPPAPLEGESVVPLRALEATRRARNDWKEKAARAEGELTALRKQLDEAKAAPTVQPTPQPEPTFQPQPRVNFADDPAAWAAQLEADTAERLLHQNANMSERVLRDKIGAEKLAEVKAEFKKAADADPTLYARLRQQADPYAWVQTEVERMRLLADVGTDPAAYRAKIEQEARAKWEAELAAQPEPEPVVSRAAGHPRSLATVRSVAARAAPAFTGEPSLTQILAGRKF